MTGVRTPEPRQLTALFVALLGLAALIVAGCGDDPANPTYPDQPDPIVGTWFLGVWGTAADDIYVVGQPGLIYHYDGATWSRQESGTEVALTDIWGDDAGNIYISGHQGVILRKSGGGDWASMDSGTDANLFGVGRFRGTVFACGRDATLLRLQGGSWAAAPEEIFVRDSEQTVIDTVYLSEDEDEDEIIESLTSIADYGITGADGVILMEDPETDWQLRRITGGEDWVTCSTSSDRIEGNFVATDDGRLFQLKPVGGGFVKWDELFSAGLGSIVYGLYSDLADTVWAVTNDGRITRIAPPSYNEESYRVLYDDGLVLFDIWGTSGTNLYAVGMNGRVLHFYDTGDEFKWVQEDLGLPATKNRASRITDKFGRPVR